MLLGRRYDHSAAARFLTRDPIGYAGGVNLYAYCRNNPVNWVDPLGLCGEEGDDLIGEMAGAFPEWRDKWALPLAGMLVEGYKEAAEDLMGVPGMILGAMGAFDGPGGGPPKRGGRLGNQETRDQVAEIADGLAEDGWTITGGGGREPEEYLRSADGGRRGGAYPDITAVKDGTILRINTIDTCADGRPTKRESAAAEKIRNLKPGTILELIPKAKKPWR